LQKPGIHRTDEHENDNSNSNSNSNDMDIDKDAEAIAAAMTSTAARAAVVLCRAAYLPATDSFLNARGCQRLASMTTMHHLDETKSRSGVVFGLSMSLCMDRR